MIRACCGVGTTMISLSVMHFFAVHMNTQSRIAQFFSEGQYGVYVLQTVIIPTVMLTFVKILEACGYTLHFSDCYNPVSSDRISQYVIVAGWLYTIVLVNL